MRHLGRLALFGRLEKRLAAAVGELAGVAPGQEIALGQHAVIDQAQYYRVGDHRSELFHQIQRQRRTPVPAGVIKTLIGVESDRAGGRIVTIAARASLGVDLRSEAERSHQQRSLVGDLGGADFSNRLLCGRPQNGSVAAHAPGLECVPFVPPATRLRCRSIPVRAERQIGWPQPGFSGKIGADFDTDNCVILL
jgi:hypothetical protein